MADILYISLGPAERAVLNRIHSHEHVVTTGALTREPGLKIGACDGLRLGDGLNGVAGRAIAHEDRGIFLRPEQLPDILRSGERVAARICYRCSWVILLGKEHGAVVEQVRIRVVAVDEENFGNVSAARPALDMDDDVERIGDVRLDGSERYLDAALQNTTGEARETLLRGTCMNGG